VAGTPRLNSVELSGPAGRLASFQVGALVQAKQLLPIWMFWGDI
jgi:hypothetical protein